MVTDVRHLCVVTSVQPRRYVALSYRWNTSAVRKELQLELANLEWFQQDRALEGEDMPEAVTDAMSLCRELGE
jgi:hypothetical protein